MQEELNCSFFIIMFNNIIEKAQKYYRKYNNIVELSLVNYEGLNYYVRLDYDVKKKIYYLRSLNLSIIDKFDKDLVNQEILVEQPVNYMCDVISQLKIHEFNNIKDDDKDDLVHFTALVNNVKYSFSYHLFIPHDMPQLADALYMIFSNLPRRMFTLFDEMTAALTHNEIKYIYNKPFKFDLFKGDLSKVFIDKVREEGEKYYRDGKIRFLEKINNSYYATIEGNTKKLYTVIIDFDLKEKMVRTGCNCSCEFFCKHMYATFLAIRNKESYKYYKVRYIDEFAETMYDKLFTLNYFLCIGVDQDKLILVYPDGRIESVFILDANGIPMFEVVEDDEAKTLTNYIKDLK